MDTQQLIEILSMLTGTPATALVVWLLIREMNDHDKTRATLLDAQERYAKSYVDLLGKYYEDRKKE